MMGRFFFILRSTENLRSHWSVELSSLSKIVDEDEVVEKIKSKNAPKTNAERVTMAVLYAAGVKQKEIAKSMGCTEANVSIILRRSDMRDIVELCRQQVVKNAYQKAMGNIVKSVSEYDQPVSVDDEGNASKEDLMRREHGFKASLKIAETVGVVSSGQGGSSVVNNIMIDNMNMISPATSKLLDKHLSEALDGEFEEVS